MGATGETGCVGGVQGQLGLTLEQQEGMLRARKHLLNRLAKASEERLAAYHAVSLDLASLPRVRVRQHARSRIEGGREGRRV